MAAKWSFYFETGRVVEIAGLFLVGMLLQRRALFAEAAARRGLWLAVAAAGALVWVAVTADRAAGPAARARGGGAPMQRQSIEWLTGQWRALSAMAFQVAVFVLAWHSPLGRLLALLVPAGRMTLTLYVGQSLVAAGLLYGYGLGLWDDFPTPQMVLAASPPSPRSSRWPRCGSALSATARSNGCGARPRGPRWRCRSGRDEKKGGPREGRPGFSSALGSGA